MQMETFPRILNVLGEFAHLARTLFTDGMHFMSLCARSRTALAAENLFLRKQIAFYQERKVIPRCFDNVSRFILVLLSRGFAWKDALVNVTPKTFIGWYCAGFRLFWRWKSRPGRPRIPIREIDDLSVNCRNWVLFTWQQRITQIVNNTMRIMTTRAHGDSDFTH
jgi:hypothetical protein